MWKGKEKKEVWINMQVRQLPLGVYEVVFPREAFDMVATTLNFDQPLRYNIPKPFLSMIRKIFKLRKVEKYNKDLKYLWQMQHVNILPLGVRNDVDIVGYELEDKGWTHEAI